MRRWAVALVVLAGLALGAKLAIDRAVSDGAERDRQGGIGTAGTG